MAEQTYTVRPGEVVIRSASRQVVTTRHDTDRHGRQIPIAIEEGVATIVSIAEGEELASRYRDIELVEGDVGALPSRFRPEAKHLRDQFVGRKRELTSEQRVRELMEVEKVRPASLADATLTLIESGVMSKADAVAWAATEHRAAVLSGTALREGWIQAARALIADRSSAS